MSPLELPRARQSEPNLPDTEAIEPVARLLAHESRTPLNAITGFTELLLAGGGGQLGAEAQSWVVDIARAAHELEAIMASVGRLIELGLPSAAAAAPEPLALGPLLLDAGFAPPVSATPVILGRADRWAGILGAARSFLGGHGPSRRPVCRAAALPAAAGAGLRLWLLPDAAVPGRTGEIELGIAAQLASIEGASLALHGRVEIRLYWPVELVVTAGEP